MSLNSQFGHRKMRRPSRRYQNLWRPPHLRHT